MGWQIVVFVFMPQSGYPNSGYRGENSPTPWTGGYPLYWGAGCLVGNRIAGDISDNRAVNAPDSPRRLGKAAVSTPQPFRNSSLTSIASRMYAPTDVLSLGLLH